MAAGLLLLARGEKLMRRYLTGLLMAGMLAVPAVNVMRADDDRDDHEQREHRYKRYYDAEARDWHEWNDRYGGLLSRKKRSVP